MAPTLTAEAASAHHKRFEKADLPDLKKVETVWRKQIGQAIDYALALANRTQKELWAALGHNDGAQVNRWIAGTERQQIDSLFAVEWFRQPFVIALAGLADAEVTTQITMRRGA